jgi:hypothetical protein
VTRLTAEVAVVKAAEVLENLSHTRRRDVGKEGFDQLLVAEFGGVCGSGVRLVIGCKVQEVSAGDGEQRTSFAGGE